MRGRLMKLAPGNSSLISPCMVAAPSSMVSLSPRALNSRSVNTWPRSLSPASWISSMAIKSTAMSSGIASTVDT